MKKLGIHWYNILIFATVVLCLCWRVGSADAAKLVWEASDPEHQTFQYIVLYGPDINNMAELPPIQGTELDLKEVPMEDGKTYEFGVIAENVVGRSDMSPTVSYTYTAPVVPLPPEIPVNPRAVMMDDRPYLICDSPEDVVTHYIIKPENSEEIIAEAPLKLDLSEAPPGVYQVSMWARRVGIDGTYDSDPVEFTVVLPIPEDPVPGPPAPPAKPWIVE